MYFFFLEYKCTFRFCLKSNFVGLTNFVRESSNIYDIKLVYYETTFENGSNDTNLVSKTVADHNLSKIPFGI